MTSATVLLAGSWVTTTGPNTITPLPAPLPNVGQAGISHTHLSMATHQGGPFGATAKPHNYTNSIELKENEAFNTDVQTLSDLWLAKWGNEWVDLTELHEDRFWSIAYERLKQLGMVEQHYLTDRAMHVCRRPK